MYGVAAELEEQEEFTYEKICYVCIALAIAVKKSAGDCEDTGQIKY